ncbi:DNA gyrase subunit A, partial [Candidatus Dojkabacteria bacterium]|nr:DNA gyrase subunit A [Candidatus Dojkabacteria bacterium]
INQLFKYTQLQSTFNTNMVALIDNEPKLMNLKTVLKEFIKHRQQIIVRRTLHFLGKNKKREHILQGLKIALDNLDEVIKLIRSSADAEVAKSGLMKNFGLTEIQAQAILDMQLRKLAALERKKIEDELKEVLATIEDLENLVASPQRILATVKDELLELKEKFGDARITKVVKSKLGEIEDGDLIPNEKCIITISRSGYIKRLKEDTYKTQGRGGVGVKGQTLKEEDVIDTIKTCNTHDWALFFTNRGKVYKLRAWEVPETNRTSKGTALVNFLSISAGEQIEAFMVVTPELMLNKDAFIVFGTAKGVIKKTALVEFENIRTSGIAAIKLNDGDSLTYVNYLDGDKDIMMVTALGMSIRFNHEDARPMGRVA